ncbi:NUDIX hydrolase [Pontibacter sp. HSC-36F09]|uniref:NUDIX domain-containing protein n=1 Tax=Pontibacter sp. HSC-36F09 TaxID=2910966 RepID=UPI0020A12B02|nr:NUDIX hydrolase [Pontibacter sp. HSC-36F09]MCP2042217.1 8-oxo-dGTP pyrophosphatase MutT (NUDIX family) [Pontibacter sp. HSC-36F09]
MIDEKHNPWTTLSSKEIYQNPWIKVREDQVLNPNGGEGIYGVVSMKNKAIGIIPVDDEGYTYLVGQYRYPLNEYSWEIPMGGGLIENDILASAKRELQEETGFTAEKWTNIGRLHTSNSVTDEEGFVFLAQELKPGETAFEETEVIHIRRVAFEEAVRMVMDNEITDAISVAGILKAAILLEQEK